MQFLYSHHIRPDYITPEVKDLALAGGDAAAATAQFVAAAEAAAAAEPPRPVAAGEPELHPEVLINCVRQNPQYSLAAIRPGVYVLGMKDQLNAHDLPGLPLAPHVQFITDEMGFVLYNRGAGGGGGGAAKSLEAFGPYHVEQYILMSVLSKQEIAQNVPRSLQVVPARPSLHTAPVGPSCRPEAANGSRFDRRMLN